MRCQVSFCVGDCDISAKRVLKRIDYTDNIKKFPGGVTVAQEFLVLLVQVRILAGDCLSYIFISFIDHTFHDVLKKLLT
jgi:hypothetical protein